MWHAQLIGSMVELADMVMEFLLPQLDLLSEAFGRIGMVAYCTLDGVRCCRICTRLCCGLDYLWLILLLSVSRSSNP